MSLISDDLHMWTYECVAINQNNPHPHPKGNKKPAISYVDGHLVIDSSLGNSGEHIKYPLLFPLYLAW